MNYLARFRVRPGSRVSLARLDPADMGGLRKADAARQLARGIEALAAEQGRLYAQNTWAVLVVLQAMDAAGKDSTIKHVMSGVNPQGCQVFSFKAPSAEELDHDYLWRSAKALPERGCIGIHNRSYYEEVIVTRVHPEILARQHLPSATRGKTVWKRRFREINQFEHYLVDNGILVVKFFLHLSKEAQRRRFLARIEEPEKYWKFRPADVGERAHWDAYMAAYEDAFRHTSTAWAPWYVIPADHKWFTRLAVADILRDTLASLHLQYPPVPDDVRAEFAKAKKALLKDRP
jgi:PPK2 family polyphosphate:nucleotide phosphotransferase